MLSKQGVVKRNCGIWKNFMQVLFDWYPIEYVCKRCVWLAKWKKKKIGQKRKIFIYFGQNQTMKLLEFEVAQTLNASFLNQKVPNAILYRVYKDARWYPKTLFYKSKIFQSNFSGVFRILNWQVRVIPNF